jgi:FkbM family methyltransferase
MNLKTKIKESYKSMVFKMSAGNNLLFILFYRFLYNPGRGSLSEFTDLYSKSKERITVIQVGANDGINNDPIHKFIKRDNWQGVLLEPQKFVFENFLEPLYKKTKGIFPVNAALDKEDCFKPVYKLSISNSRWATGLTSFNRIVLEEAINSGYVEKQASKEGCKLPSNNEDYITEELVECLSTETLLKRYKIEDIDWLQIDTEGFDYEIIKMFNIEKTKPRVIVYENLHLSGPLKNECSEFLKSKGYECRDFGGNTLAMYEPEGTFSRFFS